MAIVTVDAVVGWPRSCTPVLIDIYREEGYNISVKTRMILRKVQILMKDNSIKAQRGVSSVLTMH